LPAASTQRTPSFAQNEIALWVLKSRRAPPSIIQGLAPNTRVLWKNALRHRPATKNALRVRYPLLANGLPNSKAMLGRNERERVPSLQEKKSRRQIIPNSKNPSAPRMSIAWGVVAKPNLESSDAIQILAD